MSGDFVAVNMNVGSGTGPSADDYKHMTEHELIHQIHEADDVATKAQAGVSQLVLDSATKDSEIEALLGQITDKQIARSKKQEAAGLKFDATMPESDAYQHKSPNTLRDLDFGIRRVQQSLTTEQIEEIEYCWGLVFKLPDAHGRVEFDPTSRLVSHEVWVLVMRLLACDLHVKYSLTVDDKRIIIQIGATNMILCQTATESRIGMRLQETRGFCPFHPDLVKYFAQYHGGLNEWDPDERRWIPRDMEIKDVHKEMGPDGARSPQKKLEKKVAIIDAGGGQDEEEGEGLCRPQRLSSPVPPVLP